MPTSRMRDGLQGSTVVKAASTIYYVSYVFRLRKLRHRGVALVDWQLTFAAAAYNLVRLRNLEATCP